MHRKKLLLEPAVAVAPGRVPQPGLALGETGVMVAPVAIPVLSPPDLGRALAGRPSERSRA